MLQQIVLPFKHYYMPGFSWSLCGLHVLCTESLAMRIPARTKRSDSMHD